MELKVLLVVAVFTVVLTEAAGQSCPSSVLPPGQSCRSIGRLCRLTSRRSRCRGGQVCCAVNGCGWRCRSPVAPVEVAPPITREDDGGPVQPPIVRLFNGIPLPAAPPPAESAPVAPPPAESGPVAPPPAESAPVAPPPAESAPAAPPPAESAPVAPPPAEAAAPQPAPTNERHPGRCNRSRFISCGGTGCERDTDCEFSERCCTDRCGVKVCSKALKTIIRFFGGKK